jgi:hypothetical protein
MIVGILNILHGLFFLLGRALLYYRLSDYVDRFKDTGSINWGLLGSQ